MHPGLLRATIVVISLSCTRVSYAQQESRSMDATRVGAMLGTFIDGRGAHPAAALRLAGHSRRAHADVVGMINKRDEIAWEIAVGAGLNIAYRRIEILPGLRGGVWRAAGRPLNASVGPHIAVSTRTDASIGFRAEVGSRLRMATGELAGGHYMLVGVEARIRNRRPPDR